MTDFARLASPEPLAAPVPLPRYAAFRAAGRHTKRVRLLRRIILAGAVLGLIAVLGFALNPFRKGLPAVSIDSLGLNGTKVTMDHPKLAGFKSDGRPYTLNAREAVQDARSPNILELHDLDAHVTMSDKSVAHVVSSFGIYDSSKETMTFDHDVHLTSNSGYDVHMSSAFVAFKDGVVDTQAPITVVMNSGTVRADSMHMGDDGKEISFVGHVRSVMVPPSTAAATAENLKGTGQ